ncbi:hypothetical protein BDR06DRAFT_963731 [Suillus hirtellus]|nr:hypothetical protein BDR06DRAFT_963731 [Suillus hirtellus]
MRGAAPLRITLLQHLVINLVQLSVLRLVTALRGIVARSLSRYKRGIHEQKLSKMETSKGRIGISMLSLNIEA